MIAQEPAGATSPRGSTVRLTVAIEPKQIAVPDVVGRSQNSATKTLSRRGFEVAAEEVTVDSPTRTASCRSSRPRRTATRSIAARR